MSTLAVNETVPKKRLDLPVIAAFLAIYVIWGSTFLAIRIAVLLIPPWFSAGVRFFTAGTILYVWAQLRGEPRPTAKEWRSLAVVGVLMFSVTYGALFWGEQFVPSGITSVLEATMPLMTVLLEVFVLRQQRLGRKTVVAMAAGFVGVSIMMWKSGSGGQSYGWWPCLVILCGSFSWCLGSVLTRTLAFPKSRIVTAGAEMMLGGVLLLGLSAATGEMHPFPHIPAKAAIAEVYLIVAGSLVGFTAFVYLLRRMPASRVASHAFVNPVVAIALGYFVAAEEITVRTLVGAGLVVGSVVLTLREG
jgi:drug/metabolite transporter (DMT)-like permease